MTNATAVAAKSDETPDGGDVELTELVKIEPTRVDGVTNPANGFPILMMKSVASAPDAESQDPAADAPPAAEVEVEVTSSGPDAAKSADTPAPDPDGIEDPGGTGAPPLTPQQRAEQALAAAKAAGLPDAPQDAPAAPGPAAMATPRALLDAEQRQRALAYVTKALAGDLKTLEALKAAAPDGDGNDEASDLDGAAQVLVLLARLICSEAEELATGDFREAIDISILLDMVNALRYFIGREEEQSAGSFAPADDCEQVLVAMSARDDDLLKAKYTAEQLRQMLKDGKAFKNPDGEPSYPIGDKDDLDKAISAVGRGKGDHDAIRAYIIKRAKALGASDMIPDGWNADGSITAAKAAQVSAATPAQASADEEQITKIVTKAVAEARKADEERIKALEADLAKVRATPIPGGPMLITPPRTAQGDEHATKAAQYRATADRVKDPDARRGYLALAAEEDAKRAA